MNQLDVGLQQLAAKPIASLLRSNSRNCVAQNLL